MYLNSVVKTPQQKCYQTEPTIIKWVTHLDQFGFTVGSQRWFDMHESINVLLPGV